MIEVVGFVGSGLILLANLFTNIKTMRIVFLIANILFVVYAMVIKSPSILFCNGVGSIIQLIQLIKLWRHK